MHSVRKEIEMAKYGITGSAITAAMMLAASAAAQDDRAVQVPDEGRALQRESRGASVQEGEDAIPAKPGDGPGQDDAQGEEEGFYRASEVLGSTVRGEGGEELGTIRDLMIDRESQTISHFILDEDNQAAPRERTRETRQAPAATVETRREIDAQSSVRVVPWSVARPQFTQQERIVNVPLNQQRWQQAPTYTWQEIQAGPRAGWYNDVNRFYGVQPGPGVGVRGLGGPGPVEVERDGDVEIRGRGPDGRRQRIEIEND